MKTPILSIAWFLIGLAIGGYVGYRYYESHVASEAVQQMVKTRESSDHEKAARAVLAIEMIESGDTQQALRLLSYPIGTYYSEYADIRRHDEHSTNLIARIEQLAKTNAIVASRIVEAITNSRSKMP
jgi:hypothetical protein